MQVSDLVQLAVHILQDCHPVAKKVIIQSDNSSGFDSQELILLVFNMNTGLRDEKNLVLSRWIFTEAHIGKIQLDTHY